MTPGRQKKHNPGLPQRMRQKGKAYYYVKNQKWMKIGDTYAEAIARWQELEGVTLKGSTVGHAIDRYLLEILPEKAQATQREHKRYAIRLREVFGDTLLEYIEQTHIAQYLNR